MRGSQCVFCEAEDAPTMDHVPPQSFFPPKLPSNVEMVSAPSCYACRDATMKTDGTLRNLFVSTEDAERHPVVIESLLGKRDRSFEHRALNVTELMKLMKKVERHSPGGIYLGEDWAFDFNNPLMDAFAERLARALLWYEFKESFFKGSFGWRMNLGFPEIFYENMRKFGRLRKVHDIFAYGIVGFSEDKPAWIVADFFGCTELFIRAEKEPNSSLNDSPSVVEKNSP
jgi:hypothetical protein